VGYPLTLPAVGWTSMFCEALLAPTGRIPGVCACPPTTSSLSSQTHFTSSESHHRPAIVGLSAISRCAKSSARFQSMPMPGSGKTVPPVLETCTSRKSCGCFTMRWLSARIESGFSCPWNCAPGATVAANRAHGMRGSSSAACGQRRSCLRQPARFLLPRQMDDNRPPSFVERRRRGASVWPVGRTCDAAWPENSRRNTCRCKLRAGNRTSHCRIPMSICLQVLLDSP